MLEHKPIGDVIEEDWNERFVSGGWSKVGGNLQSLIFCVRALQAIHESPYGDFLNKLQSGFYTLHDYGCAEGDGTAFLQARFPLARVTGFDTSEGGLARARTRWPTVCFKRGDVRDPQEDANVIWTSHTVEHMTDPAHVVWNLMGKCKWLVVLVPPIPKGDQSAAHTNAVPINVWVNQLPTPPLHTCHFTTERIDPEKAGHLFIEDSFLFIFQGRRSW